MASNKELQEQIDDLQGTIDQVSDIVDDALDPSLTREEVIEKLQEIDGLLTEDEDDEEEEDNEDEAT